MCCEESHSVAGSASNIDSIPAADVVSPDTWSVDEVVQWCISTFDLTSGEDGAHDPLLQAVRDNGISGEVLPQLTLQDCKELCQGDTARAVRIKVQLNKLQAESFSQQQQDGDAVVAALNNLQGTVSEKLQEFQSQYSRLRLDVLELIRRNNGNINTTSPSFGAQPQPTGDYFDQQKHPLIVNGSGGTTNNLVGNGSKSSVLRSGSSTASVPALASSNSFGGTPGGSSTNEPLKQLRASKEDSCEKILRNAMKRHKLNEQDWRQYVLVICYGDQERVLELDEKPVVIFKTLKQQGLHPAIMLRQRGDFEEVGDLTPGGRL